MKDKIAIVTVYNACNYGSFLQAFALQKFLKERNYDVSFVEIPADYEKVIGAGMFPEDYINYEKAKYEKLVENQKSFNVVDKVDESYRCAVIGSDTVWNLFDPAYSKIPYFTGGGLHSERIISYAASIGPHRLIKFILRKGKEILSVRQLDAFGVRDDKTEFIVKLMGKKPVRVLDPTFLVDFEEKQPEMDIPNRYMLVYTYGFSEDAIRAIKQYAKMHELKIIATGSLCEWADDNAMVDSFEWLWLIKNAECVVTNTFHGTVFSILYEKRFISLAKKAAKIESLLNELGLIERMQSHEKLVQTLDASIDYNKVKMIQRKKTDDSKQYLIKNIEGR